MNTFTVPVFFPYVKNGVLVCVCVFTAGERAGCRMLDLKMSDNNDEEEEGEEEEEGRMWLLRCGSCSFC